MQEGVLSLLAHGPRAAASQSLLLASTISKTPRPLPDESKANSHGSCPESLAPKMMPGCLTLVIAMEFSTRFLWIAVSTLNTDVGNNWSRLGFRSAKAHPTASARSGDWARFR